MGEGGGGKAVEGNSLRCLDLKKKGMHLTGKRDEKPVPDGPHMKMREGEGGTQIPWAGAAHRCLHLGPGQIGIAMEVQNRGKTKKSPWEKKQTESLSSDKLQGELSSSKGRGCFGEKSAVAWKGG